MSVPEFNNPAAIAPPVGAYAHGALIKAGSDILHISGQVGLRPDGTLPASFAGQAAQALANILAILEAHGMTPANLVKMNHYLVDGNGVDGYREVRREALGAVTPASTLIFVPRLADPKYLVEIEAVAAR